MVAPATDVPVTVKSSASIEVLVITGVAVCPATGSATTTFAALVAEIVSGDLIAFAVMEVPTA